MILNAVRPLPGTHLRERTHTTTKATARQLYETFLGDEQQADICNVPRMTVPHFIGDLCSGLIGRWCRSDI
jgi:hypothetical protein